MYVKHDENDDLVIQLAPDEFEALSQALAAQPPPSPALAPAMAELKVDMKRGRYSIEAGRSRDLSGSNST